MIALFRRYARFAAIAVALGAFGLVMLNMHRSKRAAERERDELMKIVRAQEGTTQLREGVYQRTVTELGDVRAALDSSRKESLALREEVEKRRAEVVYYSDLTVRWKKKYEGIAKAYQEVLGSEEDPPDPDDPVADDPPLPRIRVTFERDFGPFRVDGHTVTSPPEAYVSVSQTRPLRLGVALVEERDGGWSTVVSSSEEDIEVSVDVTAKHRDFERIDWRDKLSVGVTTGFLGEPSLGVGMRYGGRISVGPECSARLAEEGVGWSCGVGLSWRPFDR